MALSATLSNLPETPGELVHELGFQYHDTTHKRTTADTQSNSKKYGEDGNQVVLTLMTANPSRATRAINTMILITQVEHS